MTRTETHVIVGAGLAGATAAATLRQEDFEGRIILVGDESRLPYELPPLSKGYLRGEQDEDALLVRKAEFYEERDIEFRSGTAVVGLDLDARLILTDRGESFLFDRLLIATGSTPRRLKIPGSDLHGVFQLRTVADADAIRSAARDATAVVVVGGGWIGAEVAASLRQVGLPVALVGNTEVPLQAVLGREVGAIYRRLHEEHGVELHMPDDVVRFVGTDRVSGIETRAGQTIDGDLVIVGVGATPRLDLATAAGLKVDGGIVVNEFLQSRPGVFAAGDVAAAWHPLLKRRLRVEHWDNAKRQGAAAARNMLGQRKGYDRLPYFYSDQFDLGMEYVGVGMDWDEVVLRGNPAGREFIAFWLKDGYTVAAMNANIWDVNDDLRSILLAGHRIGAERLRNTAIPLTELAGLRAAA
jgi:3-phenylpropionate/trans-cinnamate dioxygenase ferredoxin reductase component